MSPTLSEKFALPSIAPNAELVVRQSGMICRMGVVLVDETFNLWGVTARHVFVGLEEAEIISTTGIHIGNFIGGRRVFNGSFDDVRNHVAFISLKRELTNPVNIFAGTSWPLEVCRENDLLGGPVSLADAPERALGVIIETNSYNRIAFKAGEPPEVVKGGAVVLLDAAEMVPHHAAGSLLVSPAGDAAGIALATFQSSGGRELVLCPVETLLEGVKMRLWVPPGAHWAAIEGKVHAYSRAVDQDMLLTLGPRPPFRRQQPAVRY